MTPPPATAPIPQPRPDPILGNITDLDPKAPVQSMMRLARRTTRLPIQSRLMLPTRRRYAEDIRLMHRITRGSTPVCSHDGTPGSEL